MNSVPCQKLCELLATYGRSLYEDPRLCESLLRDACGQYKREIFVLVSAIREQVVADLAASPESVPHEVLLPQLTKRLQDTLAFTEEAARWAVEAWALALEKVASAEQRGGPPAENPGNPPTDASEREQSDRDNPFLAPLPGFPPLRPFEFDVVTVYATGEVKDLCRHQAHFFIEYLGEGTSLEMVAIPGGTFWMGSPYTETRQWDRPDGPQHRVAVAPFFIGKYPVTQAQWQAVATLPEVSCPLDPNSSYFKGDEWPVERVSWYEAVEFCARLSRKTRRTYRLPSEAEWEYACRAGTITPFHFGETITSDLANYDGRLTYALAPEGKCREETTRVGSFQVANAFGLYDMHGNVWEWCADPWHPNYRYAPSDGGIWELEGEAAYRVLRGGSWDSHAKNCRSASRLRNRPENRDNSDGFRVAIPLRRLGEEV